MARAPRVLGEAAVPLDWDALDNAPAPRESTQLIGHWPARTRLAESFAEKPPQALLLEGPLGIGKATFAFQLANALVSGQALTAELGADPDSRTWHQIAAAAHPNVLHLRRPYDLKDKKFKSEITVDEVRKINRFVGGSAAGGGWRVIIVDPADELNINAANALLKSLEEPPRQTLFILLANVSGLVTPTIRSRCRSIRLRPLSTDDVAAVLQLHGADTDVAQDATGSARRGFVLASAGRDTVEQARRLLQPRSMRDSDAHHALAEMVGGRGKAQQFAPITDLLLDAIAERAKHYAASPGPAPDPFARIYLDAARRRRTLEEYNLDRKEFVLAVCAALAEADKAAASR